MAIAFTLGAININSQNTNSAVAVGENQLPGWAATGRRIMVWVSLQEMY